MNMTKKKILLFGFIAVMLIGIPLTLYGIKLQQETRQQAEKATALSFFPDSSDAQPLNKGLNEEFPLDIQVDPGTNLVSFLKLEIQYDETKLATSEAADAFKVNEAAFPVTLEGPVFTPGKIAVTLSIGSDPTNAVQQITKALTLKFKGIAKTDGVPTNVTYGNNTEVLSIGSNDQASENVLLNVNPAVILIGEPGDTPTPGPSTTTAPTSIPVPTTPPNPTTPPVPTTIPPTAGPTAFNQIPLCTALNIDRETTGIASYSLTFTAVGSDADGTISKVTFNYGDGPVETVTETGGIGSNAVSVQRSHTYNNAGTYQASATVFDNMQGVSDMNSCKITIVVNPAPTKGGGGGGAGGGGNLTPLPSATIADPGPGDVILGIGGLSLLLVIVGGLLFFAL